MITEEQILRIRQFEGKPLRTSRFYGMDNILREYLSLPSYVPVALSCYLEHGISPLYEFLSERLKNAKNEFVFLDNGHRAKLLGPKPHTHVLGPLFVHWRRMHRVEQAPDAKGTLVFPSHSTHTLDWKVDWVEYAQKLKQLPEAYHPIGVSVYWRDVLNGLHQPFIDAGFEVFTNGHILDPNYAQNFYGLLSRYRFATSNFIGSYAFYATEMGIPFFLFEPHGLHAAVTSEQQNLSLVKMGEDSSYWNDLNHAFSFNPMSTSGLPLVTPEAKALVDFYLNEDAWEKPEVLRKEVMGKWMGLLIGKGLARVRRK